VSARSRCGFAASVVLSALTMGCDTGGATTSGTSGRAAPPPVARLTVTYYPHGAASAAHHRWRLTCRPTGGDHPRRALACAELAAHPAALAPPRRPCPLLEIRGAPQTLVTGTVRGRPVRHLFRPGCEAAWTSLHALLRGR
jgi:hypothetical protein